MIIDKVKVIKSYLSEVLIPFRAKKGDIVKRKEKPTQWEGWLFCKTNNEIYGWVPKAYLTPVKDSSEEFQFNRTYDAFEISALEGEIVKIIEIESGWALIENESGKFGWIPLENLDYIEP